MRTDGSQDPERGRTRGGPSWTTVAVAALFLGIGAIVLGFDAPFYAEDGGREEAERAIPCDPQPDGSCSSPELIERQARREPKLMAKLNEVGRRLFLVGMVALLGGLILLGVRAAMWARVRASGRPNRQRLVAG
jgi:hypothetical protein